MLIDKTLEKHFGLYCNHLGKSVQGLNDWCSCYPTQKYPEPENLPIAKRNQNHEGCCLIAHSCPRAYLIFLYSLEPSPWEMVSSIVDWTLKP